MQTIDIKGKKWIIDLDWEILAEDNNPIQESKKVAKKTECNYGILVDYDNQFAIGLSKKNSRIPSASLYLALANQDMRVDEEKINNYLDWIVVEEMGDEKYWMAVINKGIPSPQFDKVYDITTIKKEITDLLENDTYVIYSPCGEIQSIFEGTKNVQNKNVNELTEGVKSNIKFKKLRGIPTTFMYGGLAILILAGLAMGVNTFLDSYTIRQRNEQLELQRVEQIAQEKAQFAAKMKMYNEELNRMRAKAKESVVLGLSGVPSKVLAAWYDVIGSLDTGTHGWKMESVDCKFTPESIDSQSFCTIAFSRTGLSTNRMLLQDYPDAVLTGDKALVTRKLITDGSFFTKPDASSLDNLPNAKDWGFDMISQLQLLKIADVNFEVKPSSDITFIPPTKPNEHGAIPIPIPNNGNKVDIVTPISIGIGAGELSIKSDNLDLLRELADNVDFKAVGVKEISLKLESLGVLAWETKLVYYVNTNNGGVSASNSEKLSANALPTKTDIAPQVRTPASMQGNTNAN